MRSNLLIAIEPMSQDVGHAESELIATMEPPLCLTGWPNPQRRAIQLLRNRCKQEARGSHDAYEVSGEAQ